MPNDTNIILGRTPTASSSVAPYLPAKAVDGNKTAATNRWLAYKAPGWLAVDLGASYVISRWAAYLIPHTTDPASSWPINVYGMATYELQTSLDNVSWTKADGVAGNAASFTDRALAAPVVGRYVRLWTNTGITGNKQVVSLQELEVYGHLVSADLASLVVSSGALVPAFSSSTVTYAQRVSYDVASLTVTPTAVDSTSTIKVNGTAVTSGQASAPINLAVGNNTINVVVTPAYGAAKTYTVTVARADSQYLTSLTLKSGTNTYALTPTFAKAAGSYTANVPYDASTVTVTPVAEGTTSIIKVNGAVVASGAASAPISMNVGANTPITVECSLPSGVKQTYTITVTRADSVLLTQIVVAPTGKGAGPAVTVSMNATDTTYGATVASNTANFTVAPTAVSSSVIIKVGTNTVISGQPSPAIAMSANPMVVQIVVTSTIDASSRMYMLNVRK